MKKAFTTITLTAIVFVNCYGQSDIIAHFGTNPAWYAGWDVNTVFPLNVNHQGPQNINFLTANTQRMTIMGFSNMAPFTDNTGYVGIGNNMPMSRTSHRRKQLLQRANLR